MDPTFYASYFRHETSHWWFRWRFDLIADVFGTLPRGEPLRILDAGCGTGQMLKCLEAHGEATGIEISPQAVGYARQRGVQRLVQGSIADPPFRDGTFDCVVALDVIEHVDDDLAILTKLGEVLRPGGHLIVTVPAFQVLWSEHDEINLHKRRYRAEQLRRRLEEAGLSIQRMTYCNTALFLPVLAVRKVKNLLRGVRRSGKNGHRSLESDLNEYSAPINNALYWLMRGETRLMHRFNFPFGVSILAVATRPAITAGATAATDFRAPISVAAVRASAFGRPPSPGDVESVPSPSEVSDEVAVR
jgi:SAM-dependent methyltransferase